MINQRGDIVKLVKDIIKEKRLEHNMTMKDLASKVGVSEGTISRWESGEIANMRRGAMVSLAKALNISPSLLMGWDTSTDAHTSTRKGIRIPVLGHVVAGIPLDAITDILDYEEITPELARTGDFFALQVQGKSMEPTLREGDIVIVKQQPTVESGETAIILINGNDATIKQVKEMPEGIMLIGHNTAVYDPHFYSNKEIEDLPIQILGKVIELRRKF
jgi:repressor LexA